VHVALVANTAWLDEELRVFRRLVVGLIDEGVRVAQVVPEQLPQQEANSFSEVVTWQDSAWPLARSRRLVRVAEDLERIGVDLIHALDGRLWDPVTQIARHLDIPVVLTATSLMDLPQVQRTWQRCRDLRLGFAAATEPLRQAIAQKLPPDVLVQTVPPGIHAPDQPPRPVTAGEWTCAVISGTGEIDEDYEARFMALRQGVAEHEHAQFFLDGQHSDQHGLWQLARRNSLLENMSIVPRRLGHREMLLNADALIHPQPLGKSRTLTLQAMGSGLPVIAREDPWVDYLLEDQTAWLVRASEPEPWVECLTRLIATPEAARHLGQRARQWVMQQRPLSRHVDLTLSLYRQVSLTALKFEQPG